MYCGKIAVLRDLKSRANLPKKVLYVLGIAKVPETVDIVPYHIACDFSIDFKNVKN